MAGDLDLLRRLAGADHGLAIVATTRVDGSVHASLVNAGVLADPLGAGDVIGMTIRADAVKLAHFLRTGTATVTFRAGWQWASADGPVRLIGPDHPHPDFPADRLPGLLRDIFIAASGTHDDFDEYDRVMVAERRVAVLVTPTRIIGT
jgi:PPOX class probable F420-dependent enzyme